MTNVVNRIKEIKQPRGGYINPSDFETIKLDDELCLNTNENISPNIVGLVVDYLTRTILSKDIVESFKISIMGAKCAERLGKKDAAKKIGDYLLSIKGMDNNSIINACKAVTYDVWFRNPMSALMAKSGDEIVPDQDTIDNIIIMVNRSLVFFERYGPITVDGFTFEDDGYTKTVDSGDGDFLTKDTLWDFKVSKSKPRSEHTLQLAMYYIMGLHSKKKEFQEINKLGIFNPRLNTVYLLDVNKISDDVIKIIEDEIICYK